MPKKKEGDRLSELLASVNEDMIPRDYITEPDDDRVRVEPLLLDLVRPDPIQPRRILPDRVHHAFHNYQLTPSQALREIVQVAQVAARQRGRPFSNLLELLPHPDQQEDIEQKLTPEEIFLTELVNLAVTIRDDGQVNPITVVDVSQGVTHQFRIETGERRYWASWILRDFLPNYAGDGMIDCIIVPAERSSVFRQAKENTARQGLTAIAMARQAALLLLTVHDYPLPDHAIDNDFYRQALDLRIPRGAAEAIYSAMGGINKGYFSYFKNLLKLSDEAMELADRHNLDEGVLRPVIQLPVEDHAEMVLHIIRMGLSSRQVEAIINQGETMEPQENEEISANRKKLLKNVAKELEHSPSDTARVFELEQGDRNMAYAYLHRIANHFLKAAESLSDE